MSWFGIRKLEKKAKATPGCQAVNMMCLGLCRAGSRSGM